jgi:hypothetical protein
MFDKKLKIDRRDEMNENDVYQYTTEFSQQTLAYELIKIICTDKMN